MAKEGISSDRQRTPVGTSNTPIETFTQTEYVRNSSGQIDPNSVKTTIFYNNSTIPGITNWVPAAGSSDGGVTWDTTSKQYQKLDGTPVFGADARSSLTNGNLRTTANQQIQTSATKANLSPEETKILSKSYENTATSTGTATQNQTEAQANTDLSQEAGNTRNEFMGKSGTTPLKYPLNLKDNLQDIVKFKMVKYRPNPVQTGGGINPRSSTTEVIGTVVLPIPSGISDSNSVSWVSDEINPLKETMASIALESIKGGGSAGAAEANKAVDVAQANATDLKGAVANYFAQAATGTSNLYSRNKGAISNPNMELLFNSPNLRQFNFTFKLSARSEDESKAIISIIRFFKQGMSPIRTASQLFLKAPHTFQIEYIQKGTSHKFLNKFKECALQTFSVDYTPENQYATFYDGAMVSYLITMQFQELEPVFNDDYTNGSGSSGYDTEIGY